MNAAFLTGFIAMFIGAFIIWGATGIHRMPSVGLALLSLIGCGFIIIGLMIWADAL